MGFKTGDKVRLKGHPGPVMVVGEIEHQSDGKIVVCVDWIDSAGIPQSKSYYQEQLEAV